MIKHNILIPIWITSIIILISLFFFIPYITKSNVNELVVQNSKDVVNQIKLTRSYYLKNIVNKIKDNNTSLIFVSNHRDFNNTLPLPATIIHDLSNIFSANTGNKFRTYSNYPFQNRLNRILSTNDKETLKNIKNSNGIYITKGIINNKPVLKVAIADYMSDMSCVKCHNNHIDKTWKNTKWKLGDIRGVIEVTSSLEQPLMRIAIMRNSILSFVVFFFLILITYYSYILIKREKELLNINDILDDRVKEEIFKNNEKEQLLIQKSKLASQGEMINNISHQWRQPISELSAILINIDIKYNAGKLDKLFLDKKILKSESILNYLSNTIDDFTSFLKPDKEKVNFNFKDVINHTLNISNNSFSKNITIVENIDESIDFYGFKSELSQVFLNLISNSKNAFILNDISSPFIKISVYQKDNDTVVTFEDNAGGIEQKDLNNIIDLYFTTNYDGSGIGLYMSKLIIEKHFAANITCKNNNKGVIFTMTFSNVSI
jgi:signal transduction histidine kinase